MQIRVDTEVSSKIDQLFMKSPHMNLSPESYYNDIRAEHYVVRIV